MEEEFDAVYKYLTRNQYPDGLAKDEKRNFRRKVANYNCMWIELSFIDHAYLM